MLHACQLCPRACRVDRSAGEKGYCGAGSRPSVALASIHRWEEPCLSGSAGAGTVFFSHCNLRCAFCQNHTISHDGFGVEVDIPRLAAIFLEQQARGVHNVDLVSPTHYAPQVIEALGLARQNGFCLPVVYNSNAYETVSTVGSLAGQVHIFLPDLKFYDETFSERYSDAPDYFVHASRAIVKMAEIAGPPVFDAAGIMQRGVMVRHLALPGLDADSRRILEWLWQTFGNDIYISLMNQYTPLYKAGLFREIDRRLTTLEYERLIDYAVGLGFENCFIQEGRTASADYVPDFNGDGVAGGGNDSVLK